MTKDFKDMRKWTEDDERSLEGLMSRLLGAFVLFCACAIAYSMLSVSDAKADAKHKKTYRLTAFPINKQDNLMKSPEVRSYSKKVSHKKITDLGDVE